MEAQVNVIRHGVLGTDIGAGSSGVFHDGTNQNLKMFVWNPWGISVRRNIQVMVGYVANFDRWEIIAAEPG